MIWLRRFGDKMPIKRLEQVEERIGMSVKEYLGAEYTKNRRTPVDIAEELGVAEGTIRKWLKRFDIPIRSYFESRFSSDIKVHSKDELKQLYYNQGATLKEMSEKFNVSIPTIARWMDDYNLQREELSKRRLPEGVNRPPKEELESLYYEQNLTISDISEMIGCSKSTVFKWMKDYKISSRRSLQISSGPKFIDFLQQNEPARNLAAASLMLNGDASDLEQVLLNAYQGRFSDQKQLHNLINQNRDEIYEAVQEGLTNLGHYIGEFTLKDRAIIPVLIGQAIGEMRQSDLTSSVKDKLVRIFRGSYGPRFNENPNEVMNELEKNVESSEGVVREIYEGLHKHYQGTLALQEDLQ
jgi:transposase